MMRRHVTQIRYLILWLLGITLLPLCAAPITVVDDRGRELRLSHPAQRIISLGPSMTELLFAIGAGEQVIAVDRASDYPPRTANLPRVGDVAGLNIEAMLAMQPDLLVVWDSGYHSTALAGLEQRIPIYYAEPRRLTDIVVTLQRFAHLTDHETQAKQVATTFLARLQALHARYAEVPAVTAFYQVWQQPLLSIGKPHLITDMMAICGIQNIFADSDLMVPRVDIESVLQRRPQVIITGTKTLDADTQAFWQHWLPPNDFALLHIDPDLLTRHTPRILEGATQLCEQVDQFRRTRLQKH